MRIGRTSLYGHLVEVRCGELDEMVLVDGRPVSRKRFANFRNTSHFFDLEDEDGTAHACEILCAADGLLSTRVTVLADGRRVLRMKIRGGRVVDLRCPACSYSMLGQVAEGDRVRCPECGEMTTLGALGVRTAAELMEP